MRFRGGEFSTGTKGNFQSELTGPSLRLINARLSRCIVILLRHSLAQKNLQASAVPMRRGRAAE